MAVFMQNVCAYAGCNRTFLNLWDLIQHIEHVHLEFDPLIMELKEASRPACLPLSYILRYNTAEPSRKDAIASDVRRKLASIVKPSSVRSNTSTGSDIDDEEIVSGQSEDSDNSWTAVEEFSSEFILEHGSRNQHVYSGKAGSDKPFVCPVPGCLKRYKNINGIKYHSKNGHKKILKIRKEYKCRCGKSYKTAQGLKNHSLTRHNRSKTLTPAVISTIKPMSLPVVKSVHGYVSPSQNRLTAFNQIRAQLVEQTNESMIRSMLENVGNKPIGEGLPANTIETIQINISNNLFVENEEQPGTVNAQFIDGILQTNSLGILTPAASPVSTNNEKLARSLKYGGLQTVKINNTVPSPPIVDAIVMPLTPLSDDARKYFIIPNSMH